MLTQDTQRKWQKKNEQHEKLADMLKMYTSDVHLRRMPLGYAGTIYNCNLSMLQVLGLHKTMAKRVLKKLHMHAITSPHNIIKEKRSLENSNRYALQEAIGGTVGRAITFLIPLNLWATRYSTWLLVRLTPKGVIFSFLSTLCLLLQNVASTHIRSLELYPGTCMIM